MPKNRHPQAQSDKMLTGIEASRRWPRARIAVLPGRHLLIKRHEEEHTMYPRLANINNPGYRIQSRWRMAISKVVYLPHILEFTPPISCQAVGPPDQMSP